MRIIMHGHHNVLFSYLPSLDARVMEIKQYKPLAEQATRVRLIKDVTDLLPQTPERAAYVKARDAYVKARDAYLKAAAAYDKARAAHMASFDVEAFHREHCVADCPWDGRSIASGWNKETPSALD